MLRLDDGIHIQEVIEMINCHVFHLERARGEDHMTAFEFSGNKPSLPPLTTESVASLIYLVEEGEAKTCKNAPKH